MSRPEADRAATEASRPDDLARAAAAVAPIPQGAEGAPVFREPWEAQAFAMTLALHERGLFTWSEWAQALSAAIRQAQGDGDCDDGSTYYRHWLAAIEALVSAKGIASPEALARRREAWDRAAHATPHGEPILLENDPPLGRSLTAPIPRPAAPAGGGRPAPAPPPRTCAGGQSA